MNSGAMVALYPSDGEADALTLLGTPPEQIHLTLVYLGEAADYDLGRRRSIEEAVARVGREHVALSGVVGGSGSFQPGEDGVPVIALVDVKGLTGLRSAVMDALEMYGIEDIGHGFSPHITLAYGQPGEAIPPLAPSPLTFAALSVVWADEREDFPLGGTTLKFAHDDDRRKEGMAALKQHGSVRKAAAATGIGKSTLHRWAKKLNAEEEQPNGMPEQELAPDDVVFDTPPGANPIDEGQMNGTGPLNPPPGDERNVNVLWVQAFYRYAHLLANGVPRQYALPAAQNIAEDFSLTADQDAEIADSITRLDMSETLYFAANTASPPQYVIDAVGRVSMAERDIKALSDALYRAGIEAYQMGINDQLLKHGASPIASITDRATINSIRTDAETQARQVAETWNRDVAGAASKTFLLDVSDAARLKGQLLHTTEERKTLLDANLREWVDGRMEWKPAQWASFTVNSAYTRAAKDFQINNNTARTGQVAGGPAQCERCVAMVGLGTMPASQLLGLPLPAHPYCEHRPEWNVAENLDASATYWAAQGEMGSAQTG